MDIGLQPQTAAWTVPPPAAGRPLSAFVAAVLGWVFPGLGQLYVGRPGKALVMLVAIGGLFYAGLALTGFTCVNPRTYSLEFAAHAFLGAPTAAAYYMTQHLALTELMPWFEVGRLYAAVAGLLNIVAVCDALGEVLEHNRQVRAQRALREDWLDAQQREFETRAAAIEAQLQRHREMHLNAPRPFPVLPGDEDPPASDAHGPREEGA